MAAMATGPRMERAVLRLGQLHLVEDAHVFAAADLSPQRDHAQRLMRTSTLSVSILSP
jgi:hypothetical protein